MIILQLSAKSSCNTARVAGQLAEPGAGTLPNTSEAMVRGSLHHLTSQSSWPVSADAIHLSSCWPRAQWLLSGTVRTKGFTAISIGYRKAFTPMLIFSSIYPSCQAYD